MFLCASIAAGYSIFFFSFYDFIIDTWLCWPFAMLVHYFFLCIFGWSFCIAFNFYQVRSFPLKKKKKTELSITVICCVGSYPVWKKKKRTKLTALTR
jgi:hypothetical protein